VADKMTHAAHAGGLPIGAVLLKQHVADAMAPGDHGSTFAGNPLVCAAAVATFDIIADPHFLREVERKGELLRSKLRDALSGNAHVQARGLRCWRPCCARKLRLCSTAEAMFHFVQPAPARRCWVPVRLPT
jgi:acetylornithine/succinyldiaminopimelate/putrescine aminotransferase